MIVLFTCIGFLCCLLSAFLMLRYRLQRAAIWMAMVVLCFTYMIFVSVLSWSNQVLSHPHLYGTFPVVMLCIGPCYFMYCKSVLGRTSRQDVLHFIPVALMALFYLPDYFLPAEAKLALMIKPASPEFSWWLMYGEQACYTLSVVTYAMLGFFMFSPYAEGSSAVRRWHFILSTLFILFASAIVLYDILFWLEVLSDTLDHGILLTMSLIVILFSFLAFRQKEVFNGEPCLDIRIFPSTVLYKKYKTSPISPVAADHLVRNITQKMKESRYYLISDLTLNALADKLEISRHTLSQILNEKMGTNFYDYINELRIHEARRLIIEWPNSKIIEIAFKCGYSNKATFNAAFKKMTGITPTQFKKSGVKEHDRV